MVRGKGPPSVSKGRKGTLSVADGLVQCLWPNKASAERVSRSLADLTDSCAEMLGFNVASSTIRATIYRHPEIFEKANDGGKTAYYRLAGKFVKQANEE